MPESVWRAVRDLADDRGHGSVKLLSTIGLGVVAGMPEHVRTRVAKWAIQADYDGVSNLTPETIFAEFIAAIREDTGNAQVIGSASPVPPPGGKPEDKRVSPPDDDGLTHEVTRILDPAFLAKKKRGVA